jgi:hypothetical protein
MPLVLGQAPQELQHRIDQRIVFGPVDRVAHHEPFGKRRRLRPFSRPWRRRKMCGCTRGAGSAQHCVQFQPLDRQGAEALVAARFLDQRSQALFADRWSRLHGRCDRCSSYNMSDGSDSCNRRGWRNTCDRRGWCNRSGSSNRSDPGSRCNSCDRRRTGRRRFGWGLHGRGRLLGVVPGRPHRFAPLRHIGLGDRVERVPGQECFGVVGRLGLGGRHAGEVGLGSIVSERWQCRQCGRPGALANMPDSQEYRRWPSIGFSGWHSRRSIRCM